jgi:hypothetical protein
MSDSRERRAQAFQSSPMTASTSTRSWERQSAQKPLAARIEHHNVVWLGLELPWSSCRPRAERWCCRVGFGITGGSAVTG